MYDYEAPPPPYEKPELPPFTEESLIYVLAAVTRDDTLNNTGLFNYHVKIEKKRLEATGGVLEDESEKLAQENVTKTWAASGYPRFSDLGQFTAGIVKVVKALVGKPVATIWTRDNDSFEAWLLSRPWVQYKIAYYVTTHHDNTLAWPEVYRHKSPQHVLRIEWLDVQEQDHCGGWLWKGEDAEQVKKGLQQPYPRRSQRLVKRQLMEEDTLLRAQREERMSRMRAKEAPEPTDDRLQTEIPPKKKQAVKTKKPSPATATKKKASKPNRAKQEPTKRGKPAKEAGPKKRKTTAKEPVSKKRKAAEPAKAKKTKADDKAATKRRRVTKS